MSLPYTRAMIHAALDGSLANVSMKTHPVFGLEMPTAVPGVPTDVLDPRSTWSDGAAYDEAAAELAGMFHENFKKFSAEADEEVRNAGPNI